MNTNFEAITLTISLLLIYSNGLEFISPKPKPEKCYGTDEILMTNCCIMVPFFSREISQNCGAASEIEHKHADHNVTVFRRKALTCNSWACILDSYNLLKPESIVEHYLDEEKFYKHLHRWAKLNPEFKPHLRKAKAVCDLSFKMYMPINICREFHNFHTCFRNYLRVNCPIYLNTEICIRQKAFFDECREYLA